MFTPIRDAIDMMMDIILFPTYPERQKGVYVVERCLIETQKGAIAMDFVYRKRPSGSQWNMLEQH